MAQTNENGGESHNTINGVKIRIKSEMTVAEDQTDKPMDGDMREGGSLLMVWVIGTAGGRIQMEPGTCFHPGCVISHTQ